MLSFELSPSIQNTKYVKPKQTASCTQAFLLCGFHLAVKKTLCSKTMPYCLVQHQSIHRLLFKGKLDTCSFCFVTDVSEPRYPNTLTDISLRIIKQDMT